MLVRILEPKVLFLELPVPVTVNSGLVTAHSLRRNEDAQILYARDEAVKIGGVKDGLIVAGHTPTIAKGTVFYTGGEVYRMHDEGRNCIFYNIDCGCAYHEQNPNGTLACLRMEDEEVLYLCG